MVPLTKYGCYVKRGMSRLFIDFGSVNMHIMHVSLNGKLSNYVMYGSSSNKLITMKALYIVDKVPTQFQCVRIF